MGVGFCVVAPKDQATRIKTIFKKHKIVSQEIGQIISKRRLRKLYKKLNNIKEKKSQLHCEQNGLPVKLGMATIVVVIGLVVGSFLQLKNLTHAK